MNFPQKHCIINGALISNHVAVWLYINSCSIPSFCSQLQSTVSYLLLLSSLCQSVSHFQKMTLMNTLLFSLVAALCLASAVRAARFDITNRCSYTVWAAAVPGGGRQLNSGQSWALDVAAKTQGARIWARTGCSFDGSGRGRCQTGDCGGVLNCQQYGSAPNTLAEFGLNQWNNLDFFDISLVDGFNVPMDFSPTSSGCTRGIRCTADINGQCPSELRTQGGCNNPCTVYKTDEYCCNSGSCGPTTLSKFFKDRCPDAYSYPKDDQTSTFSCPGGTNYRVVFCPWLELWIKPETHPPPLPLGFA